MQAITQLSCNMASALIGSVYFVFITLAVRRKFDTRCRESVNPTFAGLKILVRPGIFTFLESAIRNALYLWLVGGIVAMGSDYATAWGVFNTIRWGLIMVPVQALEASSLAFVGHAWGAWRKRVGLKDRRPTASWPDLKGKTFTWIHNAQQPIVRPALTSCAIALTVEVPLYIFLAEWGSRRFAFYLSQSEAVALITEKMWKTIDWCYIFYAVSTQLAALLLATRPRWYLYQSLVSNLLWVLPWALVVSKIGITPSDAWKYHSIVFGGSLVFSFFDVLLVDGLWAWRLMKGKMKLPPVTGAIAG
ncbi:hypothetical protein LTR04_004336 [Oleoguttula sp. CCFEE 6159]|nr:hypothetical protein LTR04_004336 [Oleoguttula sp. CCFEE 6159]